MLHNIQDEFTKETTYLQSLYLVLFNLARQLHLCLVQVLFLQTMILTGGIVMGRLGHEQFLFYFSFIF